VSGVTNIFIVGIGGQGVMRLAQVLATAGDRAGYRVVVSEVKGGAQRGGLAGAHVRLGTTVVSPIIPPGEADVIIGLEVIEAARAAPHFLRPGGVLLVNTEMVPTVSVVTGQQKMPEAQALWDALSPLRPRLVAVPATQWALELGRGVLANTILLGALASLDVLPLCPDLLLQAIEDTVPPGTVELNRQAFKRGTFATAVEMDAVTPGAGSDAGSGGIVG